MVGVKHTHTHAAYTYIVLAKSQVFVPPLRFSLVAERSYFYRKSPPERAASFRK